MPCRKSFRKQVAILGNVAIEVYDTWTGEGFVVRSKNLVVDTGLNLNRDILNGSALRPSHMNVGTGAVAVVAGDTTLGTETFRAPITRRTRAMGLAFESMMSKLGLPWYGLLLTVSAGMRPPVPLQPAP